MLTRERAVTAVSNVEAALQRLLIALSRNSEWLLDTNEHGHKGRNAELKVVAELVRLLVSADAEADWDHVLSSAQGGSNRHRYAQFLDKDSGADTLRLAVENLESTIASELNNRTTATIPNVPSAVRGPPLLLALELLQDATAYQTLELALVVLASQKQGSELFAGYLYRSEGGRSTFGGGVSPLLTNAEYWGLLHRSALAREAAQGWELYFAYHDMTARAADVTRSAQTPAARVAAIGMVAAEYDTNTNQILGILATEQGGLNQSLRDWLAASFPDNMTPNRNFTISHRKARTAVRAGIVRRMYVVGALIGVLMAATSYGVNPDAARLADLNLATVGLAESVAMAFDRHYRGERWVRVWQSGSRRDAERTLQSARSALQLSGSLAAVLRYAGVGMALGAASIQLKTVWRAHNTDPDVAMWEMTSLGAAVIGCVPAVVSTSLALGISTFEFTPVVSATITIGAMVVGIGAGVMAAVAGQTTVEQVVRFSSFGANHGDTNRTPHDFRVFHNQPRAQIAYLQGLFLLRIGGVPSDRSAFTFLDTGRPLIGWSTFQLCPGPLVLELWQNGTDWPERLRTWFQIDESMIRRIEAGRTFGSPLPASVEGRLTPQGAANGGDVNGDFVIHGIMREGRPAWFIRITLDASTAGPFPVILKDADIDTCSIAVPIHPDSRGIAVRPHSGSINTFLQWILNDRGMYFAARIVHTME